MRDQCAETVQTLSLGCTRKKYSTINTNLFRYPLGENEKCKCLIFLLDLTTKTLQDVLKLQRRCQINENTGRFHSMALGILDAKIKVVTVGDTQCGTMILLRGRSKTTWTKFGLFNPATPPPCWTVLLNRTY